MKTKNILSTVLTLNLALSACGKKAITVQQNFFEKTEATKFSTDFKEKEADYLTLESWKRLILTKEKNNYSLAQIFAAHVLEVDRENVQKFVEENLRPNDVHEILSSIKNNYNNLSNSYLYNGAHWSNDYQLINNSIINNGDGGGDVNTEKISLLEKQLLIETSTQLKSKYLNSILSIYEKTLDRSSKELAEVLAFELANKLTPSHKKAIEEAIKKNNREEAISKLQKALNEFSYFNNLRIEGGIEYSDLAKAGLLSLVAIEIYNNIKETKTFNHVKQVVLSALEISKKINIAGQLAVEIKSIHQNTVIEITNFKNATHHLNQFSNTLYHKIQDDLTTKPTHSASLKEEIKFVHKNLFNKNDRSNIKPLKAYSTEVTGINDSLKEMSHSFTQMSNNYNKAISNAELIFSTLNIKLGKDAQKILNTAKTAGKILSAADQTFKGFMKGGYVGAAVALGNSCSKILGANAENQNHAEVMNQLKVMDIKLDQILKLQKEMIALQLETMKTIRDLAMMVDEYHQDEMRVLNRIQDDLKTSIKLSKGLLDSDISQCEALIDFQLLDPSADQNQATQRASDVDLLELTHKKFFGNLKKSESFLSLVKGTSFNNLPDCQKGITNAFLNFSLDRNPLFAVYNSVKEATGESTNGEFFQAKIFHPLANEIIKQVGNNSFLQYPLHLPIKSIKNLDHKYHLMNAPMAISRDRNEIYNLKNLISPEALIRYASSLIILHPILDFDAAIWEQGPKAVVDSFFSNISDQTPLAMDDFKQSTKSRSLQFLKGALKLTQWSIAQEAILSGEPILNKIFDLQKEIFEINNPCSRSSNLKNSLLSCALTSNRLIMKNYLLYTIYKQNKEKEYTQAFNNGKSPENFSVLEKILDKNTGTFKNKIKKSENTNQYYLELTNEKLVTAILLPKPEEFLDYHITYSENMEKLIKLQSKLIDEIIALSPLINELDHKLKIKYSALILSNAN